MEWQFQVVKTSLDWDLNSFEAWEWTCALGPGSDLGFLSKDPHKGMCFARSGHHALVAWEEMASCPSLTSSPWLLDFTALHSCPAANHTSPMLSRGERSTSVLLLMNYRWSVGKGRNCSDNWATLNARSQTWQDRRDSERAVGSQLPVRDCQAEFRLMGALPKSFTCWALVTGLPQSPAALFSFPPLLFLQLSAAELHNRSARGDQVDQQIR